MFNNIMLYMLVVSLFIGLYEVNEHNKKIINSLKVQLIKQKEDYTQKIKQISFKEKVQAKKDIIESKINRDKNQSVSIDSTRFYLK